MKQNTPKQMIEIKVLDFNPSCDDARYIHKFHSLRNNVFIGKMKWSLSEIRSVNGALAIELDEYDCHLTKYVLAVDKRTDEVIGGARLLRTDREEFASPICEYPSSYMIRDAYLNRLEGLPTNLCFSDPPQDKSIWELTRFVSTGNLRVGQKILKSVNDYLCEIGAKECLFLGPVTFMRMAKMMGFSPVALGHMVANEEATFLAFSCGIVKEPRKKPAANYNRNMKRVRAVPIAELFDDNDNCVGTIYCWNTGEEDITWHDEATASEACAQRYHRIEIPDLLPPTSHSKDICKRLPERI
ncbi:MAG: acyl-homoserine-lactone synthase [Pseudomonadota bacterium]